MPQVDAAANLKSPTLEETERWIEQKIASLGAQSIQRPDGQGQSYTIVRNSQMFFNGCSYSHVLIEISPSYEIDFDVWEGSLSDLIRLQKNDWGGLSVFTSGGRESVRRYSSKLQSSNFPPAVTSALLNGDRATVASLIPLQKTVQPETWNFLLLPRTVDEVMGQRIGDALVHAANLCRAQDAARHEHELDKSRKRSDEPF